MLEPTRFWGGALAIEHAHAWRVTGRGGASAARRGSQGLASRDRNLRRVPSPGATRPGPMYRALYAFRSAEPNAMAFAAGETFLVLERSSTHWWLAARARSGETGYVPPAYLHRLQVSVSLPARPLARTPSPVRRTDPGSPARFSRTSTRQGV